MAEYWKGKKVTDYNSWNFLTKIINTITVWSVVSWWTHLMTYVTNNRGKIHSNIKGHHQCKNSSLPSPASSTSSSSSASSRTDLTKRSSTWSPFSLLQHNAFLRIEVNASWKIIIVFWNSYWGVWIWNVQLVVKGLEHLTCNPIVTSLCRKQDVLLFKLNLIHNMNIS